MSAKLRGLNHRWSANRFLWKCDGRFMASARAAQLKSQDPELYRLLYGEHQD